MERERKSREQNDDGNGPIVRSEEGEVVEKIGSKVKE